jgi:hypothetical protein
MTFPLRTLSVLATTTLLTACAGMSEQACLVSDWRTVGFEDGAGGRPVATIGSYRQACSKHGISPDLDSYRAGHAEGVEIYCRPGNGFETGRSGAAYHGVCPADMEPDFIAGYNSGHHLFELESALRRIDAQIASNLRAQENIKRELTAIGASMVSDGTSAEERVALVGRAAELGQRHGELSTETDLLRQERVLHERDLLDYRETLASGF